MKSLAIKARWLSSACAAVLLVVELVGSACASDYTAPPPSVWAGVYKPFASAKDKSGDSGNGFKTLAITGSAGKFHADGTLTNKGASLAIKADLKVANEDGAGKYQNLYTLCKSAKGEPFILIKADNYTAEGKAHPGQYYFYSCYFTAGDADSYLSGRLTRSDK